MTMRQRSAVSTNTGVPRTEISICRPGSSPISTGGNRVSDRAAETATCRITSPSGRSPRTWPMHPRRSPPRSCSDTNAPRRSLATGMSGIGGAGAPARFAAIAPRANASSARLSGASMVLLSAPNRVGAIELLVDDDARKLVRQRQRPETPGALGAAQDLRRQPVMVPDDERDVAAFQLPAADQLGELRGAPRLAPLRQRDHARILGNPRHAHFAFLDLSVMLDPAQVFVTGRPERSALHPRAPPAQGDEAIPHQA